MIRSIDLAWISVNNIDKAKTFFVDTLGLQLKEESKEYGWLELAASDNGFRLGIGQCAAGENPVQPGANAILTMTVDNIHAAKELFEQKKVTILGEIFEVPGTVKMLFFQDEDGNTFQLVELLYANK